MNDDNTSNLPPHDETAERALLGAVLTEPALVRDVERKAGALQLFYVTRHRDLWNFLCSHAAKGPVPEPAMLYHEFCHVDEGQDTVAWLGSLLEACPASSGWEDWADILADLAVRRRGISVASKMEAGLRDVGSSAVQIITEYHDSIQDLKSAINGSATKGGMASWVEPVCAADLLADRSIVLPSEVVCGLLHRGCKATLGGASKSRKTWSLLDLALSVSLGIPWWGFDTSAGRVLFINLEVPQPFIIRRLLAIGETRNADKPNNLDILTLRGLQSKAISSQLQRVVKCSRERDYAMIVIDPVYRLISNKDENAAGDISGLCEQMEQLAYEANSAIVFAAHFSKGNQASKDPMDRIGGSGVFARDADSLILMTKHEEKDAYTVDFVMRNHKEIESRVVRWQYPLMVVDTDLDPENLKQAAPGGRPKEHSPDRLLDLLPDEGLLTADWQDAAEGLGISRATFFRIRKQLSEEKQIFFSKVSERWMPNIKNR